MVRKRVDTDVNKWCPGCKARKPLEEFSSDRNTISGRQVYCKVCGYSRHTKWRKKNLPKTRTASKKWREQNPRLAKDHKLRSTYGIPIGTYDRLLSEQNGKCAICETDKPGGRGDFHVDHCHETGNVRGLLCHGCNIGLGHFLHSLPILERAISYLRSAEGA